ncbi:MAG: hypothetical protein JKX99_03845 [Robiginitomaculum sp.]|nr:hypothetical protein [Robiginitomaculum sp.]
MITKKTAFFLGWLGAYITIAAGVVIANTEGFDTLAYLMFGAVVAFAGQVVAWVLYRAVLHIQYISRPLGPDDLPKDRSDDA